MQKSVQARKNRIISTKSGQFQSGLPIFKTNRNTNRNLRRYSRMETWDAYDKDFNKVHNATLIRGEAIPEGLFHLVCDIIVKHTDGSYLLMQRDRCKQFGGMWEATAGGSALQNESPLDCAIRELQEETGIRTDNLVEVGRERSNDTIYVEFLCVTNCNKDCITLQDGETIAYKWVSRSELVSLKKSELVTERMQKFIEELQL